MRQSSIRINYLPILSYVITSVSLVIFQSSRRISLWDFSNYSDLGIRIAKGQIPYIDFPLYTQPGTFFEIAIFTKIFGQNIYAVYLPILIKLICLGFLLSLILKKISKFYLEISSSKKILLMFALGFLNPWFIVPQSTYDADLAFAVILSLSLILISWGNNIKTRHIYLLSIFTAISLWLPFLYKQTSGFIWLLLSHVFIIIFYKNFSKKLIYSISIFNFFIVLFLILLHKKYNFISLWYSQTIDYITKTRFTSSRSPINQLIQLREYQNDFFVILIISFVIFCIINKKNIQSIVISYIFSSSLYLIYYLILFIFNKEKFSWDTLFSLTFLIVMGFTIFSIIFLKYSIHIKVLQLIIIFTCIVNFLSQGLVGSSYAFWQIYILLFFMSLNGIEKIKSNFSDALSNKLFLSSFVIIVLSISLYSFSLIRMDFVRIDEDVKRYPKLYGWIGTPGNYLEETQTGIDLFNKYSKLGKTAVWPGEDPVSLFSEFVPATDISTSDNTTNPSYLEIDQWLSKFDIEYLVWKTRLHLPGLHQASIDALTPALESYQEIGKAGVYKILKRVE